MEEDIQLVDYSKDFLPKDDFFSNYHIISTLMERLPRALGVNEDNIIQNPNLG